MKTEKLFALTILAFAAGVGVHPAAAQKAQTIETAHEFLEKTSVTPLGFDYVISFPKRANRTVVSLKRLEDCQSGIIGDLDYEAKLHASTDFVRLRGPLPKSYIDWTLARGIEQRGSQVGVDWGSESYWFRYPSADLAARAAFAMEFLRVACDPTADLAF